MKKYSGFLLATAGGVAAASAGAQAADLPIRKAPAMVPAPAVSWNGFYVGLHAGANWQQAQTRDAYIELNTTASDTGFIGGGQIGYNWQNGNVIYGFEADGSGLTGSPSNSYFISGYAGNGVQSSKIEWLSTVRGRMGLAVGNAMAYATAGLAIGGVKSRAGTDGGCGSCGITSESKTRLGWVVGGGIEHMFSPNWTLGLEGLFVDLGDSTLNNAKTSPFKASNQAVIGRFKLNYKW